MARTKRPSKKSEEIKDALNEEDVEEDPAKKKSKTIKAKASKHDPPPAPEAPPGARVVDASSRGVGKSGKELKAPANRKSPNGSAKDFPEEVARGNDGQWYVSCQDVKGRWFWKKADDDELAQVGF